MATNNRFASAVHIMTTLAYRGRAGATSAVLAKSMNTNPVVVRRLLSQLHREGLIECHTGKSGGCYLAMAPGEITLHDIFDAVEEGGPFAIPDKPANQACEVSCQMKDILVGIFEETQRAITQRLRRTSLADLLKTVRTAAA